MAVANQPDRVEPIVRKLIDRGRKGRTFNFPAQDAFAIAVYMRSHVYVPIISTFFGIVIRMYYQEHGIARSTEVV